MISIAAWSDGTPEGVPPPGDEATAGQKIQIQTSPHPSRNKGLLLVQPNMNPTGKLRYTPRPGQAGMTSIKFRIVDNGGSNFGGDPVGNEVTVTFTITP
jgi:hypothetical protein